MRTTHRITGSSARDLRAYLKETYSLSEGEDVFYLAHVLAFLIHDTSAEILSLHMKLHRNKFAMRKLRAGISLLENVFGF